MNSLLEHIGSRLAGYLSEPGQREAQQSTCSAESLEATLQKGDILLVEGTSRISAAIKYLTQSTWSHAAFYIGDALDETGKNCDEPRVLIEAHIKEGVRAVPLSEYCKYHTRICRPVGLSSEEMNKVVDYMVERIGYQYDLKNIFDLARYLIQSPPVPHKHRRRLLALGSGDPTRAICSSLIAQAFQSVNYPILPEVEGDKTKSVALRESYNEILHIRHHSLFAPRDFDVSPYFKIIKPTIEQDFDHHKLTWAKDGRGLAEQQSGD